MVTTIGHPHGTPRERVTGHLANPTVIMDVINREWHKQSDGPHDTDAIVAAVERIVERDPAEVARNATDSVTSIETWYMENDPEVRGALFKGPARRRRLSELHKRAAVFRDFFEDSVFGTVIHSASSDLGEHVVLKSPAALAEEAGEPMLSRSKRSTPLDDILGNTSYVFANSTNLPSLDNSGQHKYKIVSEDGYVAAHDVFIFILTEQQKTTDGDHTALKLNLYARNIYTVRDFKDVFALYSAALFNNAADALSFHKAFGDILQVGDVWRSVDDPDGTFVPGRPTDEVDRETFRKMRQLYDVHGIFPPMVPEFQFRSGVVGERVPA